MATEAVAYRRLSPRPDGQYELGLDRQDTEIRRIAKARKLQIVREFVDEDSSAFKGKRPQYQEMLAGLRSGAYRAVVAYDVDRLYRRPRELEDLIDLADSGVQVLTAQGEIDLSTSNGRAMARVVVAMASKSSEDESRRMKLKHTQLAEHGEPAGGKRPFGYKPDRVTVDKREAKLIREAADYLLDGGTLRGVIRMFEKRGVTTANGKPWRNFTIKHVLTAPRIAGLRAHRGQVVGKAVWPGIITPDEHERLKAILTDPARTPKNSGRARRYLLTGFAVCGECGARLVARPRGDGARSMVCASDQSGCGKIRALAEPLEHHVRDFVLTALDSPELRKMMKARAKHSDGEVEQRVRDDEAALDQLARDHYVDRLIGRSEFEAARVALVQRLETNRSLLVANAEDSVLASLIGAGNELAEQWETLALDRQRAVVGAVLRRVVVSPAVRGRNFFDADRVTFEWAA